MCLKRRRALSKGGRRGVAPRTAPMMLPANGLPADGGRQVCTVIHFMTFRNEIQAVLPDLLTDRSTHRRLPVDVPSLLPRWRKRQAEQAERTRTKAEVATPSWLARDMTEMIETELMGDWQAYVRAKCLEITCGEAPFLCQMYDCVSGRRIPVSERGGIFDRKLRRVSEHCEAYGRWNLWALYALQARVSTCSRTISTPVRASSALRLMRS